jgi:hypothetical protein
LVARGRSTRWAVGLAAFIGAATFSVGLVETAAAGAGPEVADAAPYRVPASDPGPASLPTEPSSEEADAQILPTAPPSPEPAVPHGDVVETIVPEGADAGNVEPAEIVAPATASPESRSRTDIDGWARESTEWTLARTGYRQGAPNPLDVPHDRFISRTQLLVRATHVRGRWFEATVSGVLGYSFREQGPSTTDAFDGVNGQATAADVQADLRELYIGLFSKYVDFRIGQQRVAWGRADLQSPNDVLNARDLRDPILTESELRHVPTPLLRADVDLGAVGVELVGSPIFVPDVYDVYGTNWAAIQQDAPATVKALLANVWPSFDPAKQGELNALLHESKLPAANFTAPSGGAKVSASLGWADVDFYYHYGFDSTPLVSPNASALSLLLAPTQPLSATYIHRHHIGFDAAVPAGPLALRLDAAYETQRVYYHVDDLTSLSSPSFLAIASIEYQTGDIDKVVLFEATYNRIVDTLDKSLLGYDQDSFAIAGTVRWPLWEGWAVDLRGLAGVEPVSFTLEPALRWKINDAVLVKGGGVLLAGENNSVGWYYRHNTCVFLQVKYSF